MQPEAFVLILMTITGAPSANGYQNHNTTMFTLPNQTACIAAGEAAARMTPQQSESEPPQTPELVDGQFGQYRSRVRWVCIPRS